MNVGPRVVLCGMLAEYNAYGEGTEVPGQRAIAQLIMRRAVMKGFLLFDHADRFPEAIGYLAGLHSEGKLNYDETVIDGLENARDTLNQMFEGSNVGSC